MKIKPKGVLIAVLAAAALRVFTDGKCPVPYGVNDAEAAGAPTLAKRIGDGFNTVRDRLVRRENNRKDIGYSGILWDQTQIPKRIYVIWGFRNYSPAREAGVQIGDHLLKIDNLDLKKTSSRNQARFYGSKKENDEVVFHITRNGREMKIKIRLGRLPAPSTFLEAIRDEIYLRDNIVRVAVRVTDVDYKGPPAVLAKIADLISQWKVKMPKELADRTQAWLLPWTESENFSIIDPVNPGTDPASWGVTHLLDVSYVRFCKANLSGNSGGQPKTSFPDQTTYKLIKVPSGEVLCMNTIAGGTDADGRPLPLQYDAGGEEYFRYMEKMAELRRSSKP